MTGKRPFRFGVVLEGANSRAEWQAKAHKVEDLGYSTLLVPDHFFTRFSPVAALLSAAEATKTLRVGSFVFANGFRYPAVLAKEVATLAVLTEGRFDLGIGVGWHGGEHEQAGISFDAPGVRVSRLEESIYIIKQLFADEPATFSGQYYTIMNLNGLPKLVQRPHPPIFIGGAGKRLLSLAAREADIVGVNMKLGSGKAFVDMSGTALARRVSWIREAAGERFAQLELNLLIQKVIATDRRYHTVEQYISKQGWGESTVRRDQVSSVSGWSDVTVEQVLEMPYFLIGSVDQFVEKLQMLREQYGVSYFTLFEEALDTFAPVVARLAGS